DINVGYANFDERKMTRARLSSAHRIEDSIARLILPTFKKSWRFPKTGDDPPVATSRYDRKSL
ncbi:MAG: hypothetical protein ACLFTJ_13275, partial [Halothece sp.]